METSESQVEGTGAALVCPGSDSLSWGFGARLAASALAALGEARRQGRACPPNLGEHVFVFSAWAIHSLCPTAYWPPDQMGLLEASEQRSPDTHSATAKRVRAETAGRAGVLQGSPANFLQFARHALSPVAAILGSRSAFQTRPTAQVNLLGELDDGGEGAGKAPTTDLCGACGAADASYTCTRCRQVYHIMLCDSICYIIG